MDIYQQFIAKSRYCRYLPEQGRRESWDETVCRYFDFMEKHLRDNHKYVLTQSLRDNLTSSIVNLEVMPSMRCMMTAGTALERSHVAGYNPVVGSTKIVTKEYGNIPIENLVGKQITVLNKNSQWADATINCFGVQPIKKVTFRLQSSSTKQVECTGNHRWVLKDGTVKSTDTLMTGDSISFASIPRPEIDDDYILGIRHGLVYGDGTTVKSCKRVKGYHIRLCNKSKELLWVFDGYPISYPPSANGEPLVYLFDGFAATHELKNLPSMEESDSYLLGFVRGWLAADGSVTKASQVSLCMHGEAKDWFLQNCEKLGFVVQRVYKQPAETNYGKRKRDSFVIYLNRTSCVPEDFLCEWKKENFLPLHTEFKVVSVEDSNREELVYCAEVPDTNTFVIEGGLVTGNCSYLPVDNIIAFDEAMYILMCGTGVGFSVERQEIGNLPQVPRKLTEVSDLIVVEDSKEGWCLALRALITGLYDGCLYKFDVTKIRPAGSPLKTFGGRASGPEPLIDLFKFVANKFKSNLGVRLTSLDCHDIMCKIGDVVVVGGVRRSAMISLSNLSDMRMQSAKTGEWWKNNPQRALANNSICYTEKPEVGIFMKEWNALYESKSGERGIFNRAASEKKVASLGRRETGYDWGTNPCSEIILRPKQFCNLSEVVVRHDDDIESLVSKVRYASILGTFQSTLTNLPYLSKEWTDNTVAERLLGVSLTGIMDNRSMNNTSDTFLAASLVHLRQIAVGTNKQLAQEIGIPQSAAVTCVKPSGTVSQLVDSASGIHTRHSPYYIRRVRSDIKDPLTKFMIEKGVEYEPCVNKPDTTVVFSFPQKAPEGAMTRSDITAIEHLNLWLTYQNHWCEHKPSITVTVKESEWPSVGAFVWDHFDDISGVSFMPEGGGSYRQTPYEEITKEQYEEMYARSVKEIDWSEFKEVRDNVEGAQSLACTAGSCEI